MLLDDVPFWPATPPHDARYVPDTSNNERVILFLSEPFTILQLKGNKKKEDLWF